MADQKRDITEIYLLKKQLSNNLKNLAEAQRLAHIGSWEMDIVQGKNSMSKEACRIYGITPEQFDGTYEGFLRFVHSADRVLIHSILENPPKEQPFEMEFRIIKVDGTIRSVYQLVEVTFDQDGKPIFLRGTIQDITEKKEMQKKLALQQETINKFHRRFQVLVQDSQDVFEIISPDGTIQYISPAVEKVFGYKPTEMIDKNIFEFVDKEDQQKLSKLLESILSHTGTKTHGEFSTKTRAGNEIIFEVTFSNLLDEPSVQGIVINWRDVTNRVEMEREMTYIATHDELTGLPNYTYFNKQMEEQCQHAQVTLSSFAVMLLDIDDLNYINDALGHLIGDQLIIQIAQRLNTFVDDETLICRYFGDQFVIMRGFRTREECESTAKDIIGLFSHPFKVEMYELNMTMSMGISIYPMDGQDVDSLRKHINIALLRAKQEGKNRYQFYSSDTDIQNYKQFTLRNDLRKAIERDQLRVYYQPQVKLETNEILAAEALIRWEHPDWGMVSPIEFISLAEETGFIINLGNWMLREVCRNYKKWLSAGLPAIKVSINYSSIQFFEKNFIKNIKSTIDEFHLDPHFLIIEVTESILMKNSDKAISDIKSLRALGIQVALDDFGTGFSSLSYLNSLKIDIFKIDRSFIKDIFLNNTSAIITRTVVNLARELGIKLVAEGIETWEQLFYLRNLNCYTGQGYLYSKPVALKEFEKILARGQCKPIGAEQFKPNCKMKTFIGKR